MKFIIIFLLSTNILYASNKNASTQNIISANLFNSSTLAIGSIQQSLLSVSKFNELNGDCWVRMEGQSIAGSDLATFEPLLNPLPDTITSETFFRQKGNSRDLGSYQSDMVGPHSHSITMGSYWGTKNSGNRGWSSSDGVNAQYSTNTSTNTGTETRPKNIAVNFFIKINKSCQFN